MKRYSLALAFPLWIGLLGAGSAYFMAYDARPGEAGHVSEVRPDAPPEANELLFFVHPHCPCSRSGLALLAQMDATDLGRLRIVFVLPKGSSVDWCRGKNWNLVQAVPRAEGFRDVGGALAKSFGVRTSGHAVIYSSDGRLLFSGGLSSNRNAAPIRPGLRWDWKMLLAEQPTARPVVGCPLFDDEPGN